MTAANPSVSSGQIRGGLSSADLRVGQRIIWTQTDGARVFVIVTRFTSRTAWLRCHYGDRAWTRRHELPLFRSMRPGHWTSDDVKQEAEKRQ